MNLLLLRETEREGERLVVRGARAAHIRRVIGAEVGQSLRVGLPREAVGTAQVLEVLPDRVVLGKLDLQPISEGPPLRLVLALPRPKALQRILQTAASFGVAHIDLVNAWRVDKSYWGSPRLAEPAIEEQLWLGCEQGRHAWLPTLATHRLFMPFVASFETGGRSCLLAHPGCTPWMSDLAPGGTETVIAIGPEGGWVARELASLEQAGFTKVCLSNAILRSEVALAAALAQWELVRHERRARLDAGGGPG